MSSSVECRLVRVEGRVQGVGFREACVDRAASLGVQGWVRNRFDGSVEVLVQGRPDAVARLVEWLHRGPPAARVERVEARPRPPEDLPERFERRPSA